MKSLKVTRRASERAHRTYADACATAHALDLLGERWALLVVRELMFGPRRFSDLRASLPGVSANVLTQRLAGLEASGVLVRRRLPPPAASQVYELTAWGAEAEPIFRALGRWGARSPAHDPTLPFSAASLILSLRTMLDVGAAAGIEATIGFRLGEDGFVGRLARGRIAFARGEPDGADIVLAGPPGAVAAAIYGARSFAPLEAEGALSVAGDRALAERFASLFPLPPKAR